MTTTTSKGPQASAGLTLTALVGGADPILNKKEAASLVGISVATLDREVAAGRFPKSLVLSVRRRGWRASTVRAWIEARPLSVA